MFKLTAFLAAFLFSLSLYSQDRHFCFGVQAGPLVSTIKPDPDVLDAKFRTGFFAGANVQWAFSKHWAVKGDAQFSQRGYYYNTLGTLIIVNNQYAAYRGRIDYKLSYIDIIPQIEFRPIRHIGIAAGTFMSWQVGESVRYGDVIEWTNTNVTDLYHDVDLGFCGKLSGYFGPVSIFINYLHGLADISNIVLTDEQGQTLGQLGAKSQTIAVGAGYCF